MIIIIPVFVVTGEYPNKLFPIIILHNPPYDCSHSCFSVFRRNWGGSHAVIEQKKKNHGILEWLRL